MLDIQQLATSLISYYDLAISILSRVVSKYELRDEAMCDAGALAVSKDTGPLPGYGHVVWPERLNGWDLGRISQEHGTLVRRAGEDQGGRGKEEMEIGDLIRIVPQHACLACASYPWFYVVENGGEEVVDVWVPCKGW
jgi:D-serine deaminase-like pyridoxal phosphate-dependent protein